jgi:transcriptional regulator with XRE-family HTH domain
MEESMTAQFPLHPGDLRQLMQIRRYLIGYRKTNGWTQPELSQMINETTGMVWLLESDQTWQWRLSRLQGWCTPFGLRLDAKLQLDDDHMNQRVHRDAEVAPLYALSQDSSAWKKWQGMYLTSALSVARRKMGISMQEVADRLKVSARAIGNWEASASELMLAKALLYARALDGYVHLELVEEEEEEGKG